MTSNRDVPSSSSSPPSPPSSSRKITYDVFLSFRGTDTRTNFTDHLYTALKQKGIRTFRDDEELERGESIAPSLLKAIEESRYVVVIFSRHYADSSWCLDEIAKAADCMKQMGQKVLPVFYDVDPSDVRNQKGEYFEKAFSEHHKKYEAKPDKVQRWKDALLEIGRLSGWHLQNGSEARVIQEVVLKISTELLQIISTNDGLVGMDSHLEKLLSHLDIGRLDVRIIGICGMGGIGKTTIAQVVYEKIKNQFEDYCFLKNVREVTEKDGVDHLQAKLLSKLLNYAVDIEYTKMGKGTMKTRLSGKRVLIVLDDVNEIEQLDALCDRDWFGPGSRIIITSRDEHLLSVVEGDQVYKVNPLNDAQAFWLFSMKAFKKDQQIGEDTVKLVKEFLSYADGLPLAIEVLGSSVKGRRIGLWPSMLEKLKKSPEKKLFKVLRVSFDGLEQLEQQIFLDIACFHKGQEIDHVTRILQGSDADCADNISIQVLLERSMVTVLGRKLWMHDMIQELGREIVRQECDIEPGRRSRLWLSNEILRTLDRSKATREVQSISLQDPRNESKDDVVHSLNDSFSAMVNLRLLKICGVKFSGNITYLSSELQYLEWDDCPLDSFPSGFEPDKLVELHMHKSRIQRLWSREQGWSMLRFLKLCCSKYLTSTPDFTNVPHLEDLNLRDCTSLIEVHPSLGCLEKLKSLNMKNCNSVEGFPPFTNLKSLQTLILSLCSSLKKFPEIKGDMKNLLELYLDGTSIEELPNSFACLTGLTKLDLKDCKNLLHLPCIILTSLETLEIGGSAIRDLSFVVGMKNLLYLSCQGCKGLASDSCRGLQPLKSLTCLIELDLSDCSLTDIAILDDLSSLICLRNFDLSGNDFVRLPESISQLSKLKTFVLSNCTKLQFIPKLPSSVQKVHAANCDSLMDFPNQIKILNSPESGITIIYSLNSANTGTRAEFISTLHGHTMHFLKKAEDGSTKSIHQITGASARKELERHSFTECLASVFPGDDIPEWFSTKTEGNRVEIPIPPNLGDDKKWHGVAVCAVFSKNRRNTSAISLVDPDSKFSQRYRFSQCTLTTDLSHCIKPAFSKWSNEEQFSSYSHLLSIFYMHKCTFPLRLNDSNIIRATFESCNPSSWDIQICGIRLVYEQDDGWYAKLLPPERYIQLNDDAYAIRNSGWLSRVDKFWKWEPCTPQGKEDSTTILQRKNLESILPRHFEAEDRAILYKFNLSGCPGWCMDKTVHKNCSCCMSVILPPNLHKCKKWMGIVVYASIAEKEPHTSEKDNPYHDLLAFKIGNYETCMSENYVRSSKESHQLLFAYIPRAMIIQEFAQTSETLLTMAFSTDSPGGELQRRGYDIVDQEGLEEFVKTIILCKQRANTLAGNEKAAVQNWITLLRLKGDSCTPNKRYSRDRRERKFELLSQKYRKRDWSASVFYCYFLGDEFRRKKWLMHFDEGNSAEIILPLKMLSDPNWMGIAVCAIHWHSHEDQNSIMDTPDSDTDVLSWHLEFDAAWDRICTFKCRLALYRLRPHLPQADSSYFMFVPRKQLELQRQCRTAKATFLSSSPRMVVRRCAIRLVYKDDIEDLVQSLTLCELP